MSPFENKGLVLGIMAGTAGLSLVVVWYRKIRKRGAAVRVRAFQGIGNRLNSVGLQNEAPNEQGAVMVLHGRQLQILEKLNGLLLSVDELKREVEFLKEAIPKLEELVRNELQGKGGVQRVSPSHRATRRRKAETTSGARETTSSEEAESEGGYLTAHTDSEGDSEEEKRCMKPPDAMVKSEEEEELFNFLQQVDNLHKGSEDDKKKGFRLLLEKDNKYENCVDFLWRLARAYGDLFEMTTDAEEKRNYVIDALPFPLLSGCILAGGTVYVSLFVLDHLRFITLEPTSSLPVSLSFSQHTVLKIIIFAWKYFSLSLFCFLIASLFLAAPNEVFKCIPSLGYFVFCDTFCQRFILSALTTSQTKKSGCPLSS
ncbi:regulator of microtubule dynamics protein 2 isoform X2 [Pipra filicauda]|uniref:Regulator of microtubule dynamics protein 2 isoform X2 n=1 Tax=Pipra filicauda TaxID=649802 RepID=A0A7R5KWC3_9PASS|nr:regulator of microtubule dynamics protein 2 isoform X2 [Pipra filicauda]